MKGKTSSSRSDSGPDSNDITHSEPPKCPVEYEIPEQEPIVRELRPEIGLNIDCTTTYEMRRFVSRSFKGKRYNFELTDASGDLFMHTKLKSASPSVIFIAKGKEMHFRDREYFGAILASAGMCVYSVRQNNQYGRELAVIKFSRKHWSGSKRQERRPRIVRVLFSDEGEIPRFLTSRLPSRSPLGQWLLDFGARSMVSSVKNAILVDSRGREFCMVMKSKLGCLVLEAHASMDPLVVFAIGLSSYLCKLT
jgi:hypothetical protein